MLAIFLRIDRLRQIVDVIERGVQPLRRILVEMRCELSPVARQRLEILRALGKRLAEGLHVVDKSVNLVRIDRLDHAIGVLRQALDLRHDRLDRLAELSQVLQRHVDVGGVVGQGLGEDVGVLKRRVNRIGVVGEKLVGAINNRDAFRRHALDVVDDRADLVRIDRLDQPIGVIR